MITNPSFSQLQLQISFASYHSEVFPMNVGNIMCETERSVLEIIALASSLFLRRRQCLSAESKHQTEQAQ